MNFSEAIEIINSILPETKNVSYDGILVKKLEASNTLDEGRTTKQTHIAITGGQMDIFPYLTADGYFNRDYEEKDESLKKYFIAQIPIRIHKTNIEKLDPENADIYFNGQDYIWTNSSVVRSRRNGAADQVQLSLTTYDDAEFIKFRKKIHAGDYLVILKIREQFQYDCFGVKQVDAESIAELNNTFIKEDTFTRVDVSKLIGESEAGKKITGGENILLYGVPGAGKSHKIATEYCSDASKLVRVVFHPDYTYSDFVGQILPRVEGENLTYKFTPGPFTQVLKKANDDPEHMYYLIIEEINRGNAPAIFGEIFQLLDRKDGDKCAADEVGESEYGISNYDVAMSVYGDSEHLVTIPSNLTLLATMNTADQNVFTLDTAFQRRWNMKQIENDVLAAEHASSVITGTDVTWGSFASVVNELIIENSAEIASSADKRLGAYFVKAKELREDLFSEKVLKYLWDDAFKFDHDLIFRDDINSLETIISTYEHAEPDKLKAVLRLDVYQKMLQSKLKKADEDSEE